MRKLLFPRSGYKGASSLLPQHDDSLEACVGLLVRLTMVASLRSVLLERKSAL